MRIRKEKRVNRLSVKSRDRIKLFRKELEQLLPNEEKKPAILFAGFSFEIIEQQWNNKDSKSIIVPTDLIEMI